MLVIKNSKKKNKRIKKSKKKLVKPRGGMKSEIDIANNDEINTFFETIDKFKDQKQNGQFNCGIYNTSSYVIKCVNSKMDEEKLISQNNTLNGLIPKLFK